MQGNNHIDIQHPEAWNLLISVAEGRLDYILYAPSVPGSLVVGEVDWPDGTLQGLEDAVYAAPVLLGDYKSVRLLVDSQHYVLFPSTVSDDDCDALLRMAFPGDDGDTVVSALPLCGLKLAMILPPGMRSFLGRTFNYPQVSHRLAPLCEYVKGQAGAQGLMFIHLLDGSMDLVAFRDGMLQSASSFACTGDQDAAYHALAAWRASGMDQLGDELQFIGSGEMCSATVARLREFVKQVRPARYPAAALQLGRNAMQAPLDLILLALCE